jgi:tRNA threonylcarbamoyl adenosine modification protein (Sua5/YciO/YrdC/YwlC family)
LANHIYTYDDPPSEKDVALTCRVLADGGVIAYPTDVNWAFAADAANIKAIDKIRKLKPHHPREQPFSLVCNNISMVSSIAVVDNLAYRILKKILPGPYTIILQSAKSLPRQIKDKRKTVGIRVPDSRLVAALVESFGKPLATTSVPGIPKSKNAKDLEIPRLGYEVEQYFGHGIELVLDLGQELLGLETTIIDLTNEEPVLIREGVGDISFLQTGN